MVDSTNRKCAPFVRLAVSTAAVVAIALTGCTQTGSKETQAASIPDVELAAGPAIWQLSDENTTVYLYGFAAALPPETNWRSAAFENAFKQADLVMLEARSPGPEDQAAMQSAIQSNGVYQDGRTLSSILNAADLELVSSVAGDLGVPMQGIDPLKPWLASIQLGVVAVTRQGFDLANTPTATIEALARNEDKTVDAFEGPTDLLLTIANLDEAEQIGMLTQAARDLRDKPDQSTILNAAWLNGDVAQVNDLLHGPEGVWSSDVVYRTMLSDRNKAWSDSIGQVMAEHEGTVFVAVGLGHLAGSDSLVSMLQARGYTVKRL